MPSNNSDKLSSTDILLYLRQCLLDAREPRDVKKLIEIQTVCEFLSSLVYSKEIRGIGLILEELENSAADSIAGVPWKSTIPSEEEIISALNSE